MILPGARPDPTAPGEPLQKLCRLEKTILLFAFATLVAVYTWWIDFRFPLQHGDSAFLAQMVNRMVETGRPVSQVAEAIRQVFMAFQPSILDTPAREVCSLNLVGSGATEFNFFRWHTLFVLYLYLPLFMLVGGELGLSLLTATSFLVVNLAAYVLLRKLRVPVLQSSLVALLLMLHPVWAGGMLGDFYVDRFFIGPAFVLCALLLTRRFDSLWLIPLAVLLALTSERVGLIVGLLLIGAVILADWRHPRAWWKELHLLVTGILCAGFTAVMLTAAKLHPHYGGYLQSMQPASLLINLREPAFVSGLLTFAAINFVAWGIPALGFWRGLLLAAGVMLPNVIGSYGGAEKTGFLTHYHSYYFPVLAVAVCLSFVHVYRKYPRWASWSFVGWLAVGGLAYNLNVNQFDFRLADLPSRSLSYPFKGYGGERAMAAQREEMAAWLDQFPGTLISTGEPFMPVLHRHHAIAFYPLGVVDADFVVLPHSPTPGVYIGAVSYLGEDETQRLNACLTRRLHDTGYRVKKEFAAGVVLSRK